MKRSAFRHYGLNQAKRYNLNVQSFGGVDYSTQKFLIADGHAIDLKNFIYKDGIVQKRHGWEEIIKIPATEYIPSSFETPSSKSVNEIHTNSQKVNGIWSFEAEDGNVHTVAHIGKLMYEIKRISSDKVEALLLNNGISSVGLYTRPLAYEFEDFKSFAFVGGKKLWFLGGNKYMVLRFVNSQTIFHKVEDSNITPIPTTTKSITYKNSIVNNRNTYDNVNLLSRWRKNELISGTGKSEDEETKTTFYEYTLDAPLIVKKESDFADISIIIKESGVI